MLEREIREMAFVPRWSIVRTNRQQYLAEHTFFVAMYANDIAVFLGLDYEDIGILLQMALWHDVEEIFSGDLPGPCKRAGMGLARKNWDETLRGWLHKVFRHLEDRDGNNVLAIRPVHAPLFEAIIKLADYIDECCEMATEMQMGNSNVDLIFRDSLSRVQNAVRELVKHADLGKLHEDEIPFDGEQTKAEELMRLCVGACFAAKDNYSRHTSIFNSL